MSSFNWFFTTIASSLVNKLPSSSVFFGLAHIFDFYRNKGVSTGAFTLLTVTEQTVCKMLDSLSGNKATGLDKLPAKYVKDGSSQIVKPLTYLINVSLTTGNIPNELKKTQVVPLYQRKSKTDAGNYRPVSVLCVISKVFERVVFNQLNDYLTANKLLYELQSGFRSSYSTDTCLIYLSDYIRHECDKGNYTGMVVLDLQKAFDTVNHDILLYKLKAVGVNQMALQWFSSYLTGRNQVVDINGTASSAKDISCGVPQGSILGPLLFVIYVNDMTAAVKLRAVGIW